MIFGNAIYLHGLWLILLMVGGYLLQSYFRKKLRRKLGDPLAVRKLLPGGGKVRRLLKFGLLLAGFSALVLALARPQLLTGNLETALASQQEIVFVVDVSNSMLVADVLPDRLTRARSLLQKILPELKGEQVGLVVFAGKAYPYLPLTPDLEIAQSAVKTIAPNLAGYQGSSLKEALKISALLLHQKSENAKTICLISDGESHQANFQTLADSLRKAGINLVTVGIGSLAGGEIPVQRQTGITAIKKDKLGNPVISKLQEENLQRIAGNMPQHYLKLETNEVAVPALVKALKTGTKVSKPGKKAKKELYPHFLLAGFLFLALEILIPLKKGNFQQKRQTKAKPIRSFNAVKPTVLN